MTLSLVQTVTVGAGGAASIDFTSIPQTETDLLVVVSGRTDNAGSTSDIAMKFNAITSGYSHIRLAGTGSSVASISETAQSTLNLPAANNGNTSTTSTFSNVEIYIPNYSGATSKSVSVSYVRENNTTTAQQVILAGLSSNTAAITSITLTPSSGSYMQYSTASLYTILATGGSGATVS